MAANSTPSDPLQGFDFEILPSLLLSLTEASAHRGQTGRPFVTLSYAQSLDGSLTDQPGKPLALSGPESQALTHRLRAAHDAILIGIGTVLADNPRLSVRFVEGRSPQPVVLDSHLRFPLDAKLLQISSPWIATTGQADPQRQRALEAAGVRVLCLPAEADGRVSLIALLSRLGDLGINSLMVEGGARVITSFLTARLVDRVVLTISPVLVGGLHALVGRVPQPTADLLRLRNVHYQQLGQDLIVWDDLA